MPQERGIFRSLTVEENLSRRRPARARGRRPRLRAVSAPRRAAAQSWQRAVRRRAADARHGRALALNPRVILLDEPLEGLAPIVAEEVLAAITEVRRQEGTAAVLVEQRARTVLAITDIAIVLERGRVVRESTSAELIADGPALDRYLGVKEGARAAR